MYILYILYYSILYCTVLHCIYCTILHFVLLYIVLCSLTQVDTNFSVLSYVIIMIMTMINDNNNDGSEWRWWRRFGPPALPHESACVAKEDSTRFPSAPPPARTVLCFAGQPVLLAQPVHQRCVPSLMVVFPDQPTRLRRSVRRVLRLKWQPPTLVTTQQRPDMSDCAQTWLKSDQKTLSLQTQSTFRNNHYTASELRNVIVVTQTTNWV